MNMQLIFQKQKLPVSSTCACTYAVPAPVQLYVKLHIAQSYVENQYKATQIIYESMDIKKVSKYHQNCRSSMIRLKRPRYARIYH